MLKIIKKVTSATTSNFSYYGQVYIELLKEKLSFDLEVEPEKSEDE